jgi:hypothetical protein
VQQQRQLQLHQQPQLVKQRMVVVAQAACHMMAQEVTLLLLLLLLAVVVSWCSSIVRQRGVQPLSPYQTPLLRMQAAALLVRLQLMVLPLASKVQLMMMM